MPFNNSHTTTQVKHITHIYNPTSHGTWHLAPGTYHLAESVHSSEEENGPCRPSSVKLFLSKTSPSRTPTSDFVGVFPSWASHCPKVNREGGRGNATTPNTWFGLRCVYKDMGKNPISQEREMDGRHTWKGTLANAGSPWRTLANLANTGAPWQTLPTSGDLWRIFANPDEPWRTLTISGDSDWRAPSWSAMCAVFKSRRDLQIGVLIRVCTVVVSVPMSPSSSPPSRGAPIWSDRWFCRCPLRSHCSRADEEGSCDFRTTGNHNFIRAAADIC